MFVVPAALHLWIAGRRVHAAILTAVAAAVACAITAAADAVYWGSAFHSLTRALDYTLLDRQSSRGFQPFYYYLSFLQNWTNWILAGLACLAWRERALRPAVLWAILPVAILSALPHKESRYLIPVIPFVAICAAAGIARAAKWTRTAPSPRLREALIVALAAAMLYELGGWRLRRSNDAVSLAQFVRADRSRRRRGSGAVMAGRRRALSIRPFRARRHVREEDVPKALRSPDLTWLALKVDTVNRASPRTCARRRRLAAARALWRVRPLSAPAALISACRRLPLPFQVLDRNRDQRHADDAERHEREVVLDDRHVAERVAGAACRSRPR